MPLIRNKVKRRDIEFLGFVVCIRNREKLIIKFYIACAVRPVFNKVPVGIVNDPVKTFGDDVFTVEFDIRASLPDHDTHVPLGNLQI